MNKSLIYLLITALVSLGTVHAKPSRVADSGVKVSLNHKSITGTQKFASLNAPTLDALAVNKMLALSSKNDYKNMGWFVYNIPICITAQMRDKDKTKKPATLIEELKIKVYLIYTTKNLKDKDKKGNHDESKILGYRLMEKEITYVNIPMDKISKKEVGGKDAGDTGYVEMSVGLFLPQASATRITGEEDPGKATNSSDLTIVAYAIEPTFKDTACKHVSVSTATLVGKTDREKTDNAQSWSLRSGIDPDMSKALNSGAWWKEKGRAHLIPSDVEILCISETPFAPFYATMYPATKPLYGSPSEGKTEGIESEDTTPAIALPGTQPVSDTPSGSSRRSSTSSSFGN